jgi:hypothetical protein
VPWLAVKPGDLDETSALGRKKVKRSSYQIEYDMCRTETDFNKKALIGKQVRRILFFPILSIFSRGEISK